MMAGIRTPNKRKPKPPFRRKRPFFFDAAGCFRLVLLIIGILVLLNAVMMLFVSNLYMVLAIQAGAAVCLILYAVFIRKIPKAIHITAAVICLLPVSFSAFLFIYGNTSNADYSEDVIIVLGAGVRGETVSAVLARRLDAAAEYLTVNPDATVIVCGGLGDRAVITEAEAMERYLVSKGVPIHRIIREGMSTSTYENLAFAGEILQWHFPDGFRAVVATNDFHLFRAVTLARHAGFSANRIGATTPLSTLPQNYIREMMAIARMLIFPPWTG